MGKKSRQITAETIHPEIVGDEITDEPLTGIKKTISGSMKRLSDSQIEF